MSAEGESLVDLLDTYMKNCQDKTVRPYGGGLFLQYDDPWNPPGEAAISSLFTVHYRQVDFHCRTANHPLVTETLNENCICYCAMVTC